jgi:hypothetical protein
MADPEVPPYNKHFGQKKPLRSLGSQGGTRTARSLGELMRNHAATRRQARTQLAASNWTLVTVTITR